MKRIFIIIAILSLFTVVQAQAGLIPLPSESNLELLGQMNITEAWDVTFNSNATSLTMDLVSYKCYSVKFGYTIEKSRWVVGAGLDINKFADELAMWTHWDLTVPILDQLGIKSVFLITYSPVELPTFTYQFGATWQILNF